MAGRTRSSGRAAGDRRPDGGDAIGRQTPVEMPRRVDRYREGRLPWLHSLRATMGEGRVLTDQRVVEAEADDAAAIADQARHGVMGDAIRRDDEIGFVLAVVVVEQQDGRADPHRVQRGVDALGQKGNAGFTVIETLLQMRVGLAGGHAR